MVDKKLLDELFGPEIKRRNEKTQKRRNNEEEMFQRHAVNYLNANFTDDDLCWWSVANEMPSPPKGMAFDQWALIHGKKRKDMGIKAGVSDMHFLINGVFRVIELKASNGRLSEKQKAWQHNVRRHRGETHVAYNMAEFHGIIKSWGLNPKLDPAALDRGSKKLLRQQQAAKELYGHDN